MLTHGGDLDAISKKYKINKNKIIDFSGNINPLGLSPKIKQVILDNLDVITRYPDKNYEELSFAISSYCGCDSSQILVGNGATELISLFIKVYLPKTALILSPSYSEYERELKNIGCSITYFDLKEQEDFIPNVSNLLACLDNIDLVIICNPNNPTGYALKNEDIEFILKKCKFLMLDETYAEFSSPCKNISCVNLAQKYENLFIIRGTSKFFSVPGIRLGYGICNKNIKNTLLDKKDLWTVNSLAEVIGISMFTDESFITQTRNLIETQKDYITKELSSLKNIKIYKSDANFILCKILNNKTTSTKIFEDMLKYNILIRDAKNFMFLDDTFFRFCILKEEENKLLIENLKKLL